MEIVFHCFFHSRVKTPGCSFLLLPVLYNLLTFRKVSFFNGLGIFHKNLKNCIQSREQLIVDN